MTNPLLALSPEEFEALCDGCGKCCSLARTCFACPSLDVATNRCNTYLKRLEIQLCEKVTPENTLELHNKKILPDTCAYVRTAQGLPLIPVEKIKLKDFREAPLAFRAEYYHQRRKAFNE